MLTESQIKRLVPSSKPKKHTDQGGLYFELHANGRGYWYQKYRYADRENRQAIGPYPMISLKEARDAQREIKLQLARGEDPNEQRKLAKLRAKQGSDNSFGRIAKEWLEQRVPHWSDGHLIRQRRLLFKDLAVLDRLPIQRIGAVELLQALRRVEARGAISTAHRVKQVAGQVFRYAIVTGRAERDPSRDLEGALQKPVKQHRAAITNPAQVGALLRTLETYSGTEVVRCALQLAPLVFCRPGELRQAQWCEIDYKRALWVIPADKMKSRREDHWIPLCSQALEILKRLQPLTQSSTYLFPSLHSRRRPMSDNTVNTAFRRMDIPKEVMCGHGFRAMARTLLEEELGYPAHIINFQLSHRVLDPLGRAYNRTTFLAERQAMMADWGSYLEHLKARG
ncbi:integrase arm-type DNA-binding domain-containing protein [Gammaproteobacteria bacterium]|nr:integrase arm-type DNA-binding domain-containing protein [Gammaproteobacteria bacterium]